MWTRLGGNQNSNEGERNFSRRFIFDDPPPFKNNNRNYKRGPQFKGGRRYFNRNGKNNFSYGPSTDQVFRNNGGQKRSRSPSARRLQSDDELQVYLEDQDNPSGLEDSSDEWERKESDLEGDFPVGDIPDVAPQFGAGTPVTANRYGREKVKPLQIRKYNKYMSSVDPTDQLFAYYNNEKRTLPWYLRERGYNDGSYQGDFTPRYQDFLVHSQHSPRVRDYNHGNLNCEGLTFRRCPDLNNRPKSSLGVRTMDGQLYSLYNDEMDENHFNMDNKGRNDFSPEYANRNFRRASSERKSVERDIPVRDEPNKSVHGQARKRANSLSLMRRTISTPDLSNQKQQTEYNNTRPCFNSTPASEKAKNRQESLKVSNLCSRNIKLFKRTIHNENSHGELSQIQKMTFSSDSEQEDQEPARKKSVNKGTQVQQSWENDQSRLKENKRKMPDTYNWGNSDDEDFRNKDDDDDGGYLYTLDNLPKYDGKTPFGHEGGTVIQVHCCIYCSLVYKSSKLLQKHFLTRSHYNKYKARLNDSEVMQIFKQC